MVLPEVRPVPPPRIARALMRLIAHLDDRAYVLGDLDEEFAELRRARGVRIARRWYWKQTLLSARPLVARRVQHLFRPSPAGSGHASLREGQGGERAFAAPRALVDVASDLRYGARTLRRSPAYAGVAVATLAIGIGGTVAIFSMVKSVVLDPLQFRDPERVIGFWAQGDWSEAEFDFVRERAALFEHLAAYNPGVRRTLTGVGDPQLIVVAEVTTDFFGVLGIGAALGRTFTTAEARPGSAKTVMLSRGFWERVFGGESGTVGSTITLDGEDYTVVGILPASFAYPSPDVRIWTLRQLDPATQYYGSFHGYHLIGRLADGVTYAQARDEATALGSQLAEAFNYNPQFSKAAGAIVMPLQDQVVGDTATPLLVLLGAAAVLLLIACTNIAGLQLNRGMNRRKEITVRAALGASRWRIVRQLVAESVLLGLVGGTLGTLLAMGCLRPIVALLPADTARLEEIAIDGPVLAVAVVISILCGVLFGLLPALHTSKSDTQHGLNDSTRTATGGVARVRLRRVLVVTQIALAVALVTSAGLMGKSLWQLLRVDVGFDDENVLTMRVVPPPDYGGESRSRFFAELAERIAAQPSVRAVGAVQLLPINPGWVLSFTAEGTPADIAEANPAVYWRSVTPDYFDAIGTPIVMGRPFANADRAGAMPVVIVNEALARRYWPGESGIGKRVQIGFFEGWVTVVGVVRDAKVTGLRDAVPPVVFQPYAQNPFASAMSLVVRTTRDPLLTAPIVHRHVLALDPRVPVAEVQALEQIVSRSVGQPRSLTIFLTSLGGTALLLGAVGLFGLVSFGVAQRTREFGVRVALGANATDILRQVLREGIVLTVLGLVAGIALSAAVNRLLASILFDVSATDPVTLGGVSLLLLCTALAASALPAMRASRVEPVSALRAE